MAGLSSAGSHVIPDYSHRSRIGYCKPYSTGTSRVQGSITKAGNTHVRRLLIESAWHHRKSYSTSGPTLRARWDKVDPALRARGHAGNRRLYKRWRHFTERRKNPLVANVAIARELAGWCWSLATM
jgi:transposase